MRPSEYPDPNRLTIFTELPRTVRVHSDPDGNLVSGPRAFPEGYASTLREAVKGYRAAHRAYHNALPTPSEGNLRQKQAQEAQREAIAHGVDKNLSPDEIYRLAGPVDFMPNHFAREVVEAYEQKLKRKLGILTAALAQHREALEAWLEGADTAEAQHALTTLQTLTADA